MYPGNWAEEWSYECDCCGAPVIYAHKPGLCGGCERAVHAGHSDMFEADSRRAQYQAVVDDEADCPF